MLLIAPIYAGITHSRCKFWDYPGEILLIILWMSYFLYPQLVSLPAAAKTVSQQKKGQAMHTAAQVMENPADLINDAIETLLVEHCELPAFSTLDRMAGRIRRLVNRGIYQTVFARISEAEQQALSRLLEPDGSSSFTAFDRIKDAPKSATLTHLDEWLSRLS